MVRRTARRSAKLDLRHFFCASRAARTAFRARWREKLEGDPHTVNLNAYTSEDGSKIMGTWICTPGKWRVDYVKWEYCHFQEGYCVITPEGLEPIHLRAGDIFVVEPGMKGTWEVGSGRDGA